MDQSEQPWARIKQPTPIPSGIGVDELAAWTDQQFSDLLRSHLVPRDQSRAGRAAWDQLWQALRSEELSERTYDCLEHMIGLTQDALAVGLDEAQQRRATKFLELCDQAWRRVDRPRVGDSDDRPPLAWAGRSGRFTLGAQRVIATLIDAIDAHRDAVTSDGQTRQADLELWASLRQVHLDPEDYAEAP